MNIAAELGIVLRMKGFDDVVRKMDVVVKQAGKTATAANRLEKSWDGLALTKTAGQLLNLVKALRGVATVISVVIDVLGRALQAEQRINSLNIAFEAIIGTASGAREEMAWLRNEADRLGQDFHKLAESYKGLLIGARNTNLEGRATREIFMGMAEAGNALGLSTQQVQGALNAVQKMMSKGRVEARDLSVELEGRLPGSFRMAAEAMGVTETKLNDMLKSGQVMAVDLLPKLARQMRETYGEAAVKAASSSTAALNRFNTAQENLMATLGEKLKPIVEDFLEEATGVLKVLNEAIANIPVEKIVLAYTIMKAVGSIKFGMLWKLPDLLKQISEQFEQIGKQGSDWVEMNKEIKKYNTVSLETVQLKKRLSEQIKAHGETTLQTQLRHLDELAAKHKDNAELIILIEQRKNQLISAMVKQIADEHERLWNEEVEAANKAGQAAVAARDESGKEIVEENKKNQKQMVEDNRSGLQRMMEDWSDMSKGWDDIAVDAMRGIEQTLYSSFRNAFEGVGNLWDNLWDGMKNIAYQVLASIATRMAKGLIGNVAMNFIPGMSGGGSNLFGGGNNMFGGGGMDYSQMANYMGFGPTWFNDATSGFTGATNYGAIQGDWAGINMDIGGTTGTAGSAAGTAGNWGAFSQGGMAAAGAVAGAAMGAYSLYNLYQNGPGGLEGAGQGMLTGAMAGAGFGPWGMAIGAAVGALAGGLGGDDDTAEREADARMFGELAEKIANRDGTQEDYIEAIKYAHRSDNRVGGQAMEQLYAVAKQQGLLDWWTPTPGQLGAGRRREYTDEQWKRYQVYGGAEEGEMGALAFMELFGGAGKGGWDGADQSQIQDVMEGLDTETIDKLGGSLSTFKDLATEWGVSIQDLLGPLIEADLAGDEWKTALEGLSAATLVQNAADAERAKGLSELEVVQNKVMRSIQLMAGWNDMDAEGKSEMIDMLREDAGRREELMNAAKRLKEVEDLLTGSHKLSKEEVEKLAQEYADLTEMLGLNDTAAADAASEAENFARVMRDEVIPALRDALDLTNGGDIPTEHDGGYIYHRGGMVGAMLRAGLITPHGGMTRMHTGGLRPDERMAILQAGEFVIKRSSVNPDTLAMLRSINATGRLPFEMMGRAMDRLQEPPRFHSGGPVTPLAASSPAPQPKGGDGGVTINMTPGAITINPQPGQDSGEIAREVQAKFLAWLQTPQGQTQVKQAADKAPERNFV